MGTYVSTPEGKNPHEIQLIKASGHATCFHVHLEDLLSDGLPAAIGAPRVNPAHDLVRPLVGPLLPCYGDVSHVGADLHRAQGVQADRLVVGLFQSVNKAIDLNGKLVVSYKLQ